MVQRFASNAKQNLFVIKDGTCKMTNGNY